MSNLIPKATHTGEIHIGDTIIPCAVLEDGTRLLTQQGFLKAIGRSGKPAAGRGSVVEKVAPFLALSNLKPFVSKELESSTFPVRFRTAKGTRAYGYKADLLPKVCEVYLRARDENALLKSQLKFANACDILIRGLAHIGIIALVDEATGYQDYRSRQALQQILEKFISKELRKWIKTFPDEFYENLFRLRGWQYKPLSVKRPGVVGRDTEDIVYKRLAPAVLNELKRTTPRDEKGRLKYQYHRRLTEDIGHPKLREHIASVITLMRASASWQGFKRLLERAMPKYGDTYQIPYDED